MKNTTLKSLALASVIALSVGTAGYADADSDSRSHGRSLTMTCSGVQANTATYVGIDNLVAQNPSAAILSSLSTHSK